MTTEQKHLIDIPGLPEGWRAVAYRRPIEGEYFFDKNGGISLAGKDLYSSGLIIEKIKPRRVVLEETGEDSPGNQEIYISGALISIKTSKLWCLVEE